MNPDDIRRHDYVKNMVAVALDTCQWLFGALDSTLLHRDDSAFKVCPCLLFCQCYAMNP
jgi:hypothetical protein